MIRVSRARLRRHPAAFVVVALLATSCGSDDDEASRSTPAAVGSVEPAAAPTTGAAVAGTAGSSSAPASASEVYTIGATLELTGAISQLGEGFLQGAEAYLDGVNDAGGVAGHPVELVALDHSNKPDQGVANVTRLVTDEGAIAITGMVLGNVCNAAERVTTERQVPMVCSGAEPDMLDPVRPYFYAAKMPTTYQAAAVLEFAATLVEGDDDTKVGYVGLGTASSSAYGNRIVAGAEENGWEVVAHEEVPPEVTDVSSQVAKIAAGTPDIVLTGLQDAVFILFMRTLQAQGVDVPVINYEPGSSITALEGAGSDNVYVPRTFSYPDSAQGPGVERYVKDVTAAGGDPNGAYVINGYLAAMIIVGGLQTCADSCTAASLQQALDTLELDTGGLTSGPVTYSADDHAPGSSVNVYRWNSASGQPELVAQDLAGDES